MKADNIQELKKQFIVDPKEYETEKLPDLVKRLMKYCKLDAEGRIHFEFTKLSSRDKVKLFLIARFIGSKLDHNINPEVRIGEVVDALGIPKNQAIARLHDTKKDRFAISTEKGMYVVASYKIEKFLENVDEKYRVEKNKKG